MLIKAKAWVDECNGLGEAWLHQCEIAGRQVEAAQAWQRYVESL